MFTNGDFVKAKRFWSDGSYKWTGGYVLGMTSDVLQVRFTDGEELFVPINNVRKS